MSMLKKAAKNILKKPATIKYPYEKAKVAEGFRGEPSLDYDTCSGCGICSRECPAQAIIMGEIEGKKRPTILLDRCIFCYHCAEICPKKAIKRTEVFELAALDKSSLKLKPQHQNKGT
ncbi:MAG: 4Fe-4S binding protein [Candidatus Bathyarchaeota archaeon]|nr:4Fe-4S binding protein [Candidatus Bathyarchaeota archaeon]